MHGGSLLSIDLMLLESNEHMLGAEPSYTAEERIGMRTADEDAQSRVCISDT